MRIYLNAPQLWPRRGSANWAARAIESGFCDNIHTPMDVRPTVSDRHCHSWFARSNSRRRSSECFVHNLSGWLGHAQRKLLCMAYFTWGGETSEFSRHAGKGSFLTRVNKWLPALEMWNSNFPDTFLTTISYFLMNSARQTKNKIQTPQKNLGQWKWQRNV
jgi:hypothetical protein